VSPAQKKNDHRLADGRFRTAPSDRRSISFTWAGDQAGQGWGIDEARGGMRTYATMLRNRPDFFIHSGDHIYADLRPQRVRAARPSTTCLSANLRPAACHIAAEGGGRGRAAGRCPWCAPHAGTDATWPTRHDCDPLGGRQMGEVLALAANPRPAACHGNLDQVLAGDGTLRILGLRSRGPTAVSTSLIRRFDLCFCVGSGVASGTAPREPGAPQAPQFPQSRSPPRRRAPRASRATHREPRPAAHRSSP